MIQALPMTKHNALRFFAVLYIASMLFLPLARAANPWWDSGWRYRVHVTVSANGQTRYDRPAETAINFTQVLTSLGKSGSLNENSIRVIETNAAGAIQNTAVPFQFDKDPTYNASTAASGTIIFMMGGTTASAATRYFDLYFETNGAIPPTTVPSLVNLDQNASDEGQTSYKVTGQGVTFLYQKDAGGFSSMLDKNSVDWLDFHPTVEAVRPASIAVFPMRSFPSPIRT